MDSAYNIYMAIGGVQALEVVINVVLGANCE